MIQTRPIFLRPTHINSGVNREGFALCGINNLVGRGASNVRRRRPWCGKSSGTTPGYASSFFDLFGTFFAQTFRNSTWIRSVCSGATILTAMNSEETTVFNFLISLFHIFH